MATVVAVASWDAWLGVVSGVVLVLATAEVLFPTRYALDSEGVHVAGAFSQRHEPWSRFTGVRRVREGFLLLGRGSRPVLRRHRTRLLRCSDEREAVQQVLDQHLGATSGASCAS